jgi:hypothetical protein
LEAGWHFCCDETSLSKVDSSRAADVLGWR